jgi:hypothetical protein
MEAGRPSPGGPALIPAGSEPDVLLKLEIASFYEWQMDT